MFYLTKVTTALIIKGRVTNRLENNDCRRRMLKEEFGAYIEVLFRKLRDGSEG